MQRCKCMPGKKTWMGPFHRLREELCESITEITGCCRLILIGEVVLSSPDASEARNMNKKEADAWLWAPRLLIFFFAVREAMNNGSHALQVSPLSLGEWLPRPVPPPPAPRTSRCFHGRLAEPAPVWALSRETKALEEVQGRLPAESRDGPLHRPCRHPDRRRSACFLFLSLYLLPREVKQRQMALWLAVTFAYVAIPERCVSPSGWIKSILPEAQHFKMNLRRR